MKLCYAVIRSRNNSPTNFNENDLLLLKTKKVPWFWIKRCLTVLESSIQNVVLRVSRRKSSKNFACGAFFFLVFLTKSLSKCPISTKPPMSWKRSGMLLVRTVYSGIFWPIQGHLETFSHVQTYWGTLWHIEGYLGIIETYGAIIKKFGTLCNPCIYNYAIFRTLVF